MRPSSVPRPPPYTQTYRRPGRGRDGRGRLGRRHVRAGRRSRSFASRPEFVQALAGGADATQASATPQRSAATSSTWRSPSPREGVVHGAVRITFPTSEVDCTGASLVGHPRQRSRSSCSASRRWSGLRFAQATVIPLARLERAADAAGARRPDGAGAGRGSAGGALAGGPVQPDGRAPRRARALAGGLRRRRLASAAHAACRRCGFGWRTWRQTSTPHGRASLEGRSGRSIASTVWWTACWCSHAPTAARATAERIDLGALVDDRVALWSAAGRGAAGACRSPNSTGPVAVHATPGRLDQVLDNLHRERACGLAAGGTITVSARATAAGVGAARARRGAGHERRGVAPGPSTASGVRSAPRPKGTGLGLAIVRRLVESDGGSIGFARCPGRWARRCDELDRRAVSGAGCSLTRSVGGAYLGQHLRHRRHIEGGAQADDQMLGACSDIVTPARDLGLVHDQHRAFDLGGVALRPWHTTR